MFRPNLKFVDLPVPEINGGTRKIWAVHGYAHAPFSPKFLMGFCSFEPFECSGQIFSPVHDKIAIGVLDGVANPNLGE